MTHDSQSYKDEIWKMIPGFENRYAVSNYGRVKRVERTTQYVDKRRNKVCTMHFDEMILLLTNYGHSLIVGLRENNKTTNEYVHRLVADAFIPNPDNYRYIKHVDGDYRNNHATNLMWSKSSK